MKVLLVCYWNMPVLGGVGTYMTNLKKGLEKCGHQVDVFGQQKGVFGSYVLNGRPILPKYKIRNVLAPYVNRFYNKHYPDIPFKIKVLECERYCFELAATLLNLAQYDVIHCQDIISAKLMSRINRPPKPLVATFHGCLTYEMVHAGVLSKNQPYLWQYYVSLEKLGITAANMTIVPTKWLYTLLSQEFVQPENMRVVPYGIDSDSFLRQMNEPLPFTVSSHPFTIVCPARLDPIKGHTVLFEALVKLKQQRHDWVCLLLGDGMIRKKLETLCRQLHLDGHVVFMGNRDDVPAILKRADIVVLPSLQDNQPFVVMEAQMAGKPVIVSDAGGIPEMVQHGKTGLISSVRKSEPLYENLAKLLGDASLRKRLGEQSKNWALERWTLETMVQHTVGIYRQVLQK